MRTCWGAYDAPPDPPFALGGKEREETIERRERDSEGKQGKEWIKKKWGKEYN